jgi:ActR/RegA family two-component response regulator
MSGHEVLVELRRLQPGIKVLIFTGYATVEGEVEGAGGSCAEADYGS